MALHDMRADRIFLTQPFGGGQVRHWTWAQAVGEVRRMAAYLKAQNWEPGSRIAILSKNCAWWVMADLAIQRMGGLVFDRFGSYTLVWQAYTALMVVALVPAALLRAARVPAAA